MREDLLKAVEADLQETQRRNEEKSLQRHQEVISLYPDIRELLERRENLIHGAIQGILRGEKTRGNLPEQMKNVSADIRAELETHGLPEDYLSPIYDCPVCKDTGYIGDVVRERCACVRKRYQARLLQAVGLQDDG